MKKQKEHANTLQAEIKPFRSLNLADDFMFDVVTDHLECCQIILELSLGIRIRSIRWQENQKVVHNLPGKRGIRLDFYVEDEEGTLYDVEMQKYRRGNLPKRTRFYQSLINAPLLKSGEESFDKLNPSYIIVICDFDLFGQGKYRYTFTNQCKEVAGLELNDGSTKIILNTKGTDSAGVEPGLIDFLHYVPDSTEGQIPEQSDDRLRRLHEVIESIRESSEMEAAYMKAETREREIIADAKAEGRREGMEEGQKMGMKEGREEGRRESIKISVENLMSTLKLTREEALDALKIPREEREQYVIQEMEKY